MSPIDPTPLLQSVSHLLRQVESYTRDEEIVEPASYEKIAKSISFQLKAVQDIELFNQVQNKTEPLTKNQNYENVSAQSRAERDRLIERLTHLYNHVNGPPEVLGGDGDDDGGGGASPLA